MNMIIQKQKIQTRILTNLAKKIKQEKKAKKTPGKNNKVQKAIKKKNKNSDISFDKMEPVNDMSIDDIFWIMSKNSENSAVFW